MLAAVNIDIFDRINFKIDLNLSLNSFPAQHLSTNSPLANMVHASRIIFNAPAILG